MMDMYFFLVTRAFPCLLDHQSTPSKGIFFRKSKTKNLLTKLKCSDAFNHTTFKAETLPSLKRIAKLSVIILTQFFMLFSLHNGMYPDSVFYVKFSLHNGMWKYNSYSYNCSTKSLFIANLCFC